MREEKTCVLSTHHVRGESESDGPFVEMLKTRFRHFTLNLNFIE